MTANRISKGTKEHIEFLDKNEMTEEYVTEATLVTIFKNSTSGKLTTLIDGGGFDFILLT